MRGHYLKRQRSSETIHEAIWVDTETIPEPIDEHSERHVLDFGYAAYRRRIDGGKWSSPQWIRFTSIDMFWEWALSRLHGNNKLYMFAHNWGFDAPVLNVFNRLPEEGFTLESAVIMSPPVILKWRKAPHTIQMIDTLNLFPMPLAKVGQAIGLPKLDMPDRDASQEEWNAYGKRDVEIIMQAICEWVDFLKDEDLGGFAPTIASQALRTFTYKFMRHKILIDDNEKALSLARDSYHGGRTECFYIGKVPETVYKLDINSQYPAIMYREYMPTKLIGVYNKIELHEMRDWLKHYCVVAKVTVETTEPVYGVVKDNRLIFPVGKFTTVLTTPEVKYGLRHRQIKTIHSCALYERAVIFKKYVEYFYNGRLEHKAAGNDAQADRYKRLLTNLYGKFAQRGMIYSKIDDTNDLSIKLWTEYDADTQTTHHYRQFAGIIEELERDNESRNSHPAIAAHITAHGRVQIWGFIKGAGWGHVYYCDTDCVWVDEAAYKSLENEIDDDELGKLKVEGIHKEATIHAPKDYVLDGHVKIKGIKARAQEISPGTFTQDKFSTIKGLLRSGDLTAPIVTRITKTNKREYKKGVVDADGWVKPFKLG